MEDQVRPAGVRAAGPTGWVVSPAFDLAFLANLGWPLLLIPGLVTPDASGPVEFWQVYFLTTPHRWITLFLVASDPDRREGRPRLFLGLAAAGAAGVSAGYSVAGGFGCLLVIDYLWNGWHFAAQHAGVLRIYGKKVGGGSAWMERHGLRTFIVYVIFRVAEWLLSPLGGSSGLERVFWVTDAAALAVPVALMAAQFRGLTREHAGKVAYLGSVCLLYGSILLGLRAGWGGLVLVLTFASGVFHATEYLAVVTRYAWRRGQGGAGVFRAVAARWVTFLPAYVLILGLFEATFSKGLGQLWVGLNLWAAFLHYAYDGLIWKLRRPGTAAALGAGA